jgi:hypothetical protein
MAFHHGSKPLSLLVNRRMPVPSQRLLDLPELGFHSLSLCLTPELEADAVLPGSAIVRKPQEIERLRLALAPLCPASCSESAELEEAGLFRMQTECELCQAFLEIDLETLRILPVLEADVCVIGLPHDDHIALCVARTPLLDPEIINVMKVHIRKQWGYDALNAKDNFQFERTIRDWKRGKGVLDMRRKR